MNYSIDWSALSRGPDLGQAVQQGIQAGAQMRRQQAFGNALSAYAKDPEDENAFMALAQTSGDPTFVLKAFEDKRERERTTKVGDLQRRAAGGDEAAKAELAGIDLDAWAKIDDRSKAEYARQTNYIGEAALRISQLPEEQRAAAWDAAAQQGVGMGFEGLAEYVGKYSPDALNAALDSAGKAKAFIDTQRIDWKPIGEAGMAAFDYYGNPTGEGNPFASGAVEPDADEMTATNPETGETVRFNSQTGQWEPMGGASQPGSPTFP